jgi:2'-5' RNA ligase
VVTGIVELARRPDVELIKTGRWQTMSGSWNPTPEDLASAVEAQACPAIRRPIVKLGHVDTRFDGEPAMGWFENLRVADGGATLLGDQVTLPWLDSIQAAAYPSRSIEGNYNHRCSENHVHKFVLTAVALLGVTPPAVQTIRNLHDLPAALGVAASEQGVPEGAEHVQVTILAATDTTEPIHTGAMVALIPTVEDAERLAVDGGEPAGQLHVTLAYLGEAADLGAQGQQDVIDAVSSAVNGLPVFDAKAFSLNVFNPPGVTSADGKDRDACIVLGLSGDMLDAVHDFVGQSLAPELVAMQHRPWVAHTTLIYTADLAKLAELTDRVGPITFDRVRIAFAGEHIDIPLIDQPIEEPSDDDGMIAAAAGNPDALHDYWTKNPKGLAKWRDKPHPWTALFKILRRFLNADEAKRTASKWFVEVTGHTPNQKGVNAADVQAGRHSLPDFVEDKHKRDNNGKFAPKWNAGALKQGGTLGSRIQLGPDESLAGGASLPSAGVAMAAVDSPNGRKLRLGLNIYEEDIDRWSGADKGHTVVLDQPGVDKLRGAIDRMQAGAKSGLDLLKVFEKRETDLHNQEQKLLVKQYPKLTAAQGKELGALDRDLSMRQDNLSMYRGRQQERLAAIPDESAREQAVALDGEINAARAAGDTSREAAAQARMQTLLNQHGEYKDITAMMYRRTGTQISDATSDIARLQARKDTLTADPSPLSGDERAELDQIRADLARNDDLWGEFNDGSALAGGTIPAEWGDIRWQTIMSDQPTFLLSVVPSGAPADFVPDGDVDIDAADLRKLAALLDKAGADPTVRAASDPAETTQGSPLADPPAFQLPAAEPEQVTQPDPKEDLVSTDLSAVRSRLGLTDDADLDAIAAGIDALKAKADAPVEPTPEMVAASAATEAEKDELRKEVSVLASQMKSMSDELAATKAEKAATVKASVFDAAIKNGQIKPADREQWEADYDEAPAAVTRVLASIAVGSAVPVMASGVAGPAEPQLGDSDWDQLTAILDGPSAKAV